MDTVKKFVKYGIWLIIGYILVNFIAYGYIMKTYKNINNYQILVETPSIEITESKATKINGYIVGKITNNTDALIFQKYLRVNFYNDKEQYLGTNYVEISNFQTGKTVEFKTSYNFTDVAKFTIDITDEKVEQKENERVETSSSFMKFMGVVGILMIIWYVF